MTAFALAFILSTWALDVWAAGCVQATSATTYATLGPLGPEQCSQAGGFFVLDATESLTYGQWFSTMADVFVIPAPSDLQAAFWAGLSAPLIFYLVAYCCGLLVHFFDKGD